MFTAKHDEITAKVSEPVQITFEVTDKNGDPVNVSTATGSYKIAREIGQDALVEKDTAPGLVFSGTQAIASFNTSELQENDEQAVGKFSDQLRITLNGDDLVVCTGRITVEEIIY